MYTIRQLITESFRASGIRGLNDTPSANETADALNLLNGILDVFWLESHWKPGRLELTATPQNFGRVTFGEVDPDDIDPAIIVDMTPPTRIVSCSVANGSNVYTSMEEMPSDLYYTRTYDGGGYPNKWFYEYSASPYPTLHVLPRSDVNQIKIVLDYPWARNVNLNTDISAWKVGMKEVIKWRLGADLAATEGFMEMQSMCIARYQDANAVYQRSNKRTLPYNADNSAPNTYNTKFNVYSGGF